MILSIDQLSNFIHSKLIQSSYFLIILFKIWLLLSSFYYILEILSYPRRQFDDYIIISCIFFQEFGHGDGMMLLDNWIL